MGAPVYFPSEAPDPPLLSLEIPLSMDQKPILSQGNSVDSVTTYYTAN